MESVVKRPCHLFSNTHVKEQPVNFREACNNSRLYRDPDESNGITGDVSCFILLKTDPGPCYCFRTDRNLILEITRTESSYIDTKVFVRVCVREGGGENLPRVYPAVGKKSHFF